MGYISRLYNFTAGATVYSAQVNAEFNQILNTINGNLDVNNLADDAVTNVKILDDAVTAEKISGATGTGAVDIDNIPDGATRKAVDTSSTADNITHAATTHSRSFVVVTTASIDSIPSQQLNFQFNYLRPTAADGNYHYAKLHLDIPNGAKMTLIRIVGVTGASDGEIRAQIWRLDNDLNGLILAAADATGGATSGDDTLNHTVDNETYSYYVYLIAHALVNVDNAKIYRIYIEYTNTDVSQT